eukprot:9664483-Ditylum_brightwellii.AAC.1
MSKQPGPTGVANSTEQCSAAKGIVKAVDVRHFSTSIGYPICEPTIVQEDNAGTVNAISSDQLTPTYYHYDVKIHRILYHKRVDHIAMVFCKTELMLADPNVKPYGGNNLKT